MQPRVHGSARYSQARGDLVHGQVHVVTEGDHDALIRRESGKGSGNCVALVRDRELIAADERQLP
jgi:hypothetical protein